MENCRINHVVDSVISIVTKLSQSNATDKGSKMEKFRQIDINSRTEKSVYRIQVTYCGQYGELSDPTALEEFIIDLVHENKAELDVVLSKSSNNNNELIYDFSKRQRNRRIPFPKTSESLQFPHMKAYVSIKMKCCLLKDDMEKFNEIFIQQLRLLPERYLHMKYIFLYEEEILYTNYVELDEIHTNCHLLSAAIEKVLKHSLNTEFRERCLSLLNIEHSGGAADAIMQLLLPQFHNNYQT